MDPNQIDTSKPVLVTGATGYIAGVLIKQLLEAGVTVHATVRDASQTNRFQYIQDVADKTNGKILFFSADLLKEDSFEEAMQGCSIVFHTASPFINVVEDPIRDLIDPAVKGTANVLNTATKTPSVTKVVFTSSSSAVSGNAGDGYKKAIVGNSPFLTEENWNRTSTLAHSPYSYSKTLAEMKAWTIAGSQTQWKMVSINPVLVLGPGLKYHDESTSHKVMLTLAGNVNNAQVSTGASTFGMGVVDVRDVAQAHIRAAYSATSSGRYLCVGRNSSFDEMAAALRTKYSPKEYPIPAFTSRIPKWFFYMIAPYVGNGLVTRKYVWDNMGYKPNFDNSKSKKELNIQYRPFEETLCDMYQHLIDTKAVFSYKDFAAKPASVDDKESV